MSPVAAPEPFWLGDSGTPVLGVLHRPPGPATGGVVVCSPFGYQGTCANRTLRALSEQLAGGGLAVLRLDYLGTGNSGELPEGTDDLAGWRESVMRAIGFLHAQGFPAPTVVGLRLGAALAAGTDGHGPLVLWAPPESGRSASRELRAQAASTPGGGRDGLLNVLGNPLRSAAVRSLRSWDPYAGLGPGDTVLVVADPQDAEADAVLARLHGAGATAQAMRSPGTAFVLERTAETAQVPTRLVHEISAWILGHSVRRGGIALTTTTGESTREIAYRGGAVREELVRLGPQGLTGVLTQGDGGSGPVVCFLNNGVAGSAGPARLWTHYARELASRGIPSLRVDARGLGTSPDPTTTGPILQDTPLRPELGDDVDAAVAALRSRGFDRVVLAGLCSGGYASLMNAALAQRPADAVVSINPPMFNLRDVGWTRPLPRIWAWVSWAMCKDPLRRLAMSGPRLVWTMADRTNVFPAPDRFLARAARRSDVTLVLSEGGSEVTDLRLRSTGAGLASPGAQVDIVDGMEHSLFDWAHRERVLEHLTGAARRSGRRPPPGDPEETA